MIKTILVPRLALNNWYLQRMQQVQLKALDELTHHTKIKNIKEELLQIYQPVFQCPIHIRDIVYHQYDNDHQEATHEPHEYSGSEFVAQLEIFSHLFPVKNIFMGVVIRTIPYLKFDDRIFLERIRNRICVTSLTVNTNCYDIILNNNQTKNKEWTEIFDDNSTLPVVELKDLITPTYIIDDGARGSLEISISKISAANVIQKRRS